MRDAVASLNTRRVPVADWRIFENINTPEEWAAHQMRTTVNFANSSAVCNWYTGGLNHQIEHHLFPSISHTHYEAIERIVRDTAQEFELPYKHFDTYGQALSSHYRFLQKLSLRPAQ